VGQYPNAPFKKPDTAFVFSGNAKSPHCGSEKETTQGLAGSNPIYHGKEGASSPVSDVNRYVLITSRDSIFNILPVLKCRREIQPHTELISRKVAYTKYDIPWYGG
jgi:hypothetical protein